MAQSLDGRRLSLRLESITYGLGIMLMLVHLITPEAGLNTVPWSCPPISFSTSASCETGGGGGEAIIKYLNVPIMFVVHIICSLDGLVSYVKMHNLQLQTTHQGERAKKILNPELRFVAVWSFLALPHATFRFCSRRAAIGRCSPQDSSDFINTDETAPIPILHPSRQTCSTEIQQCWQTSRNDLSQSWFSRTIKELQEPDQILTICLWGRVAKVDGLGRVSTRSLKICPRPMYNTPIQAT